MIAILEDEAEVREALVALLEREGLAVTAYATPSSVVSAAAAGELAPLLLADLELNAEPVFAALRAVIEHAPSTSIVALTGHAEDDWLFPAIEAGCIGYVLKSDAWRSLAKVVREAQAGGSPMTAEISRRVLRRLRLTPSVVAGPSAETDLLSEREREVLTWLADGYTYEQVAMHCGISIDSVRTYVRRTYAKLGVNTKSEATQRAMRLGLLR